MFSQVGVMPMPEGFKYKNVFSRGKPEHKQFDEFFAKHPPMSSGKRAKIFTSYDALKGFSDAVAAKEVIYVPQIILDEAPHRQLEKQFVLLHRLTINGKTARKNRVYVSITYYVPCSDINHDAYGVRGQYLTITGIVWNVDEIGRTIKVDNTVIRMEDVLSMEDIRTQPEEPIDWDTVGDYIPDDDAPEESVWDDDFCQLSPYDRKNYLANLPIRNISFCE